MTERRSLTARSLVVMLVGGILLSGCSGSAQSDGDSPDTTSSAPTSATTTTPKPPPARPETDVCRDLGFKDINRYSNTTDTIPCQQPHTAYTFAVAELPDDVAFDGVEIKNDAVQEAAAAECRQRFITFVGGDAATRALVRLTATYFLPDQSGFDRGAHWIRCDVIALQAEQILADLPRKIQAALDDPAIITDYSLCSVAEPGTPTSLMVTCNQEHAYRAIAALRLGGEDEGYPGESAARDDGRERCEDLIKSEVEAEGGYTFSWTYPTPADWDAGQRFGYCWNKTPG